MRKQFSFSIPGFFCRCILLAIVSAVAVQKSNAQPWFIGGNAYFPCSTPETVVANFTSTAGTLTTGYYSKYVKIEVSGTGQSFATRLNDAFYVDINTSPIHYFAFWQFSTTIGPTVQYNTDDDAYRHIVYDIDAGTAVPPFYTPAYRPDHTYSFITNMSTLFPPALVPTQLRVGVSDEIYTDNAGSYTVTVTQLCVCTDADGDGYYSSACGGNDCNDGDAAINPAAAEVCDGIDNDCDGTADEGFTNTDGDALADCVDPDDDNDGCLDGNDVRPLNYSPDSDGDGVHDDCDQTCGQKNDKARLCHNGVEICVANEAVASHLAHGDVVGPCPVEGARPKNEVVRNTALPMNFSLVTSPNPFRDVTRIQYSLPVAGKVTIRMYDVAGRETGIVFNGDRPAGSYSLEYNTSKLGAGIYYCKMITVAGGKQYLATQKIVKL